MSMGPDRKNDAEDEKSELVTVGDIAKLTGNRPSAVNNWEKRSSNFPKPVEKLPNGRRLFDLNEVLSWLKANDKLDGERADPERSAALALFDLMSNYGFGGSTACLAACELVGVHAMAKKSAEARGATVESLDEEAAALVADLDETFGADLFSNLRGSEIWDEMGEAASQLIGELDPTAVFDRLLEVGSSSRGRFEFYPVPDPVKDLVIGVLPKNPDQAIDIAAGTADLLAEVAIRSGVKNAIYSDPLISWSDTSDMSESGDLGQVPIVGFETDQLRARLGQLRLGVHGINGLVLRFDALTAKPAFQGSMESLASVVPFSQRLDPAILVESDWQFGSPTKADTSFGWIQRAIALLSPTGVGAVITALSPTVASRKQDEAIRAELLRRSCVEAVIELPGGTFSHTGIGSALWLLRAPREALRAEPVLFIDLASGESSRRRGEEWPPGLADRAISAVEQFRKSPEEFSPESSFSRVVSATELMSPKSSLLPSNFVGVHAETSIAALIEQTEESGTRALAALSALNEDGVTKLPDLYAKDNPTVATLKELRDKGVLTIARREHAVPGDILVGVRKNRVVAEIVKEERTTSDHDAILRDFASQFDAEFLALVLTSSKNQQIGRRVSMIRTLDALKLEVPILSILNQTRLRDRILESKWLAEAAASLEAASSEWTQSLVDVAASGRAHSREESEPFPPSEVSSPRTDSRIGGAD